MKSERIENWKRRARKLKRETYAVYLACRHEKTPWYARLLAACVVGYAFSPIDLIPDFIPILGYLDDLLIVPLGIALVIKFIPAEVLVECRAKAQEIERQGRPANLIAAATIIAVWIISAVLGGYWIFKMIY